MMKRTFPLLVCAVFGLALVSTAQADTVTLTATQGHEVKMDLTNSTVADAWQSESRLKTRSSTNTNEKSWLQFDLTEIWAGHNKADLVSAVLYIREENGTSTQRRYTVYGLMDDGEGYMGMEGWSMYTITWNNAPGNNTADQKLPDLTKVFDTDPYYATPYGKALYTAFSGAGNNWTSSSNIYGSTPTKAEADAAMTAFLKTDTDGLVTFIIAGPNADTTYMTNMTNADVNLHPYLELTFVPEPATLAILGLGGLLLRRRLA